MAGRKIELITDRDLARKRLPMFAGSDIPSTIVRKELIDNEIDVVNEVKMKATKCIIRIGKNRIQVMDNGDGLSTEIKEGTDKTHLWLACAKMFSSSNYDGVTDTVGANGVGLTIANYTSKYFTVAKIGQKKVKGYRLIHGFLCGTPECAANIEENPSLFNEQDRLLSSTNGDFVAQPLEKSEFMQEFNPYWEEGFMIDITWFEAPNSLFPDNGPNVNWLVNYAKVRAGEIASGDVFLELYSDDSFDKKCLMESKHWNKDKESEFYVPSWLERCKEHNAVIIKDGPWTIALSTDSNMKVESVVQGAPVTSRYATGCSIKIQDYDVNVQVPVSIKYLSNEYPNYQDQTKVSLGRYPYSQVSRAFERSDYVYKFFYREAEKLYMKKVIQDSDSGCFWPALGNPEEAELIIAEGYSAISGLKSQRNPITQACIALRGKILNCWNLEMQKAMNAEVVKQILNAVIYTPYKRIIIAVDADEHGSHIGALLLALFGRFTNLIQDGKVYYVHTPHYLFKKRGAETLWSDNAADCPSGYSVTTLKGLGGMKEDEVEKFIMNDETRDLIQLVWDDEAYENLDHAFSYGGESWIEYEEA